MSEEKQHHKENTGIFHGLVSEDDGTPLGDTTEVHDDLAPEDVPRDNPARRQLERMRNADQTRD